MAAAPHKGSRLPLGVVVATLAASLLLFSLSLSTSRSTGADAATTTPATTTTTTTTTVATTSTLPTTTTTLPGSPLPWPKGVSSAVAVPSISVAAGSPREPMRPIASLTKMMSTWVILGHLPLSPGQTGPCLTVDAADVARYNYDVDTGQSSAKVAVGERLCENTLLTGMLVHSAGNFVYLFLHILKLSVKQFVAQMNVDAKALGLTHTHYVEPTGISPGDRSTAYDQARLAADLMTSQAIVRSIVIKPVVVLPVAGALISYNPFVGTDGIVGVKSGYTVPAGGCEALALRFRLDGLTVTDYAVVLGQQGGNSIDVAADKAIDLLQALHKYLSVESSPHGKQLVWTGSSGNVIPTTTTTTTSTTTTTTVAPTTTLVP